MPPRLNNQNTGTGGEPSVSGRLVPVVDLVPMLGAIGFLRVLDGVIDNEYVRSFTVNGASDTSGNITTGTYTSGAQELPSLSPLEVRIYLSFGEQVPEAVTTHYTTDLTTEIKSERNVVRAGDDLVVWVVTQMPRRIQLGGNLALPVARRHENHESWGFSVFNVLREFFKPPADI